MSHLKSIPPTVQKNKLELCVENFDIAETSLKIEGLLSRLNIFEDPVCFRSLVYTVTRTWSKIKVFKLNTVLNAFAIQFDK